jgi:quercetin dioxygenase-like cupin family protein
VLRGSVFVEHDGGTMEVTAGQSVVTSPGEKIRYSTGPDGAEYIAVCLPAFSPETSGRD